MKTVRIQYLFWTIFAAQLFSILAGYEWLRITTKPMICLSLIAIISRTGGEQVSYSRNLLRGLVFCCLGDIFLMIEGKDIFFISGLAAFLIGHVFYIFQFNRMLKWKDNQQLLAFSGTGIMIYGLLMFNRLYPHIGELLVPVILYILVISIMLFFSVARKRSVSQRSFYLCLSGAVLFVISDSVLAVNQFDGPVYYGHFWVMLTYMLAQYCISKGILVNGADLKK